MKEEINAFVKDALEQLNIYIDDVYVEKKGKRKTLYIVLDTNEEKYIDLDTVVKATEILNKIVDEHHLADDVDVLDIYAKEKGEIENEW